MVEPAPTPPLGLRPSSGAAPSRPQQRRRRVRRLRRLCGLVVLLAPGSWIVLSDFVRRYYHVMSFDRPHRLGYVGTAAFSVVFWGVLLYVAARRRGFVRQLVAGLFAVLFTLCAGVQAAFHSFYNVYLSLDSLVYSKSLPWALLGYVPLQVPRVAFQLGSHLVLGLMLLTVARILVRPRRIVRMLFPLLVPVVLAAMVMLPASYRLWQSSTPDVIYVHGYRALLEERLRKTDYAPHLRVQRREPVAVPPMTAKPARARNVLFVLQESVRDDISCNEVGTEPDAACATPFSARAMPERMPLMQMRANASTTAIAISDLWSAVPSTDSWDVLLSVPLLWDYAHAAGYDAAYWTSQNTQFGSMRLYVQDFPVSHRAVATELDSWADFDAGANDSLLTDRAMEDLADLREPFFAVVQYSNVHYPYVYDPKHAPFQPSEFSKAPDKNDHFFNYYRNVVYLSDIAVGRLLDFVRESDFGKRTVIVYTSDHAESFREHWQLGHTSSLYEEEIHVPAWISAPESTLSDEERGAIRGAKEQFLWHYDVAPTLLDLLGVWDLPEMRPFRALMLGHPITRPERTVGPVPLNNCSWIWECAFRNWGMMQGPLKIEAREWDNEFHCFDMRRDPLEQVNLGEAACAPLPDVARQWFGMMPRQDPPGMKDLLWGPAPPSSNAVPTEPP
jgi:glucan phosphoethanolaminetransferase (alkaline phosphatase superfamily)